MIDIRELEEERKGAEETKREIEKEMEIFRKKYNFIVSKEKEKERKFQKAFFIWFAGMLFITIISGCILYAVFT